MSCQLQSKTVVIDDQEQTVIIMIPDADLKEALDNWARQGTSASISSIDMRIPTHRQAIAQLLDDLDEIVNPEEYKDEEGED